MSKRKNKLRVDGIDHVELVVPDRQEAVEWYSEVLGLDTVDEFERWSENGPLVVSGNNADTKLALFEGCKNTGSKNEMSDRPEGFSRVAFSTDGPGFLNFVDRFRDHPDVDIVGRTDVVDHDLSFSVYFTDPYGYRYEVTTYDYGYVADELG